MKSVPRKIKVLRSKPAAAEETVRKPLRRPVPGKPSTVATKPKPKTSPASSNSGHMTGADGFAKAREIKEKSDAEYERKKNTPFDFRLKVGESAELVMLDAVPHFVRLHNWKVGQKYFNDVCIADTGETCPLCTALDKEGTYTLVMSAADKRQYKTKDNKTVTVSKKLVKAKTKNIPKFERLFKANNGSLRGVVLSFTRDGELDAAIGEDIVATGKKVPELSLKKMGEVAVVANYEEIFAIPSAEELRARHKLDEPMGSEDFKRGANSSGGEEADDIPW